MMTFLAPAWMCMRAFSSVRKRPVDSTTISAPTSSHLSWVGSFSAVRRIFLPSTIIVLPSTLISFWNVPWTESYLSMYAR